MTRTLASIAAALTLAAGAALAQGPDVTVTDAWSRASIGTARPGVLYLKVTNDGNQPVTLTGIETDAAKMPMIHQSVTNAQGVSGMKPAGDITIAPGKSVSLEPGGYHGMLMKLTRPLNEGDTFDAKLDFGDAGEVDVTVPVLAMTATGPEH